MVAVARVKAPLGRSRRKKPAPIPSPACARACTHLAAKVSLSALGGGEGRGEVGEPARSQRRHGPPHPPAATAPGPSLSPPQARGEGQGLAIGWPASRTCVHTLARKRGPRGSNEGPG